MQYHRIETDAIEEAQTEREIIQLIQYSSSDLDDSELGGLAWVGRGREYTKITFDFALGTDGIQQPGDSILQYIKVSPLTFTVLNSNENLPCQSGQAVRSSALTW